MSARLMGRYWSGNGPLWRIFWIYGVAGSAILAAAVALPFSMGWMGAVSETLVLAVAALYTAWLLVGVWRCAFNIAGTPLGIERDGWALLARGLAIAWAINVSGLAGMLLG